MTDIVSQIAAFIRARLDKDEEQARDVQSYSPTPWTVADDDTANIVLCDHDPTHRSNPDEVDRFVAGCEHRQDAEFVASHGPDRVLRRVGGMRGILDDYDMAVRGLGRAQMRARTESRLGGKVSDDMQRTLIVTQVKLAALEEVVLRLSLEYFDHDGYLDEWKQLTGPLAP